ncbi:MAG: hypothetical protein A3F95_00430 [Candidatus Nealsonbacteria bacterium RIFCSPLOWO2_12_FULL_39_31]|uniref:Uncharacterized protein n=3 Tax=Candidatus Nealsoniibacteriota TaxID=1817911 RepID=A0A1G2EIN3_9BACT|nr:MAG: hypothetical protein A2626_01565 [Candidatus Nealsonbacteria bacterium RIFCSPHIGHO2_01_FULL_38_55]OGZ21791.1 MAG: hypothetical protein A3C48_01045 [Candidatus Nealsonbacteria bacterium RIFCSPHIGHO2_02_FULL_38_75]OGZ21984.1 MAG: hypothetical protein A2W55_02750 [Candidatus Nealsonbacteria bacterium RIFCSPHIGHO2_02_38_10]OGZ23426.1 MAG: hypothetical protein A2981_00145 [Candidatus Nealsonbacteria bacterium RIFCSPLOWO2_01_FULL_38_120]OGZ23558.1 MAG: hypothetical protein A3E18_01535 [Candid
MATKTKIGCFSMAISQEGNVVVARTHKSAIKSAKDEGYRLEDVAIINCTVFGKTCSKPPFKIMKRHHSALKQSFSDLLNNGK